MLDACAQCGPRIESYRNAAGRTACLLTHVRECCLKKQPASGGGPCGESLRVAGQISSLPEPERSAAALFYTGSLPVRQIAALLKMSVEELSDRLANARARLRAAGDFSEAAKAEIAQ